LHEECIIDKTVTVYDFCCLF